MSLQMPALIAGDPEPNPKLFIAFLVFGAVMGAAFFLLLLIDQGWNWWVAFAFLGMAILASALAWAFVSLEVKLSNDTFGLALGLAFLVLGTVLANLRPETLLKFDTRTARGIYDRELARSGDPALAREQARKFYRVFGWCFAAMGLVHIVSLLLRR